LVRYLAIDFGEKRIGLATSDATGLIATPRRTVLRASDRAAIAEIGGFARDEEVEGIVVGLPHHADGRENALAPRVRAFARKLSDGLGLPVEFVNEHLTSRAAADRYPSAEIDAAAAAVLLEDFLSSRGRPAEGAGERGP
jgi:putative Holliday junction resolvase